MDNLNKLVALDYLTKNNPLCDGCLRANLEEIRIAAGLYQVVLQIVSATKDTFSKKQLDQMIRSATTF